MIRVAIIGFGGIAQIHRYAYYYYHKAGMPIQLVAACDNNPAMFDSVTKINIPIPGTIGEDEPPFKKYTDWEKMLDEVKPDLVDICLPTGFHEKVTIAALDRGCSVLCEKPMAGTYDECKRMLEAATRSTGQLMIAHSVRFSPYYIHLYNAVKDGRYGAVTSAAFRRVTPLPNWGPDNWRFKDRRTGSSMAELNIHDFDVMDHIFGYPHRLSCHLESRRTPYDLSSSTFYYDTHTVTVDSEWQDDTGHFCASYQVGFENGTLVYDGKAVTFTDKAGNIQAVEITGLDSVVQEIGHFTQVLLGNIENTLCPPEESAHALYLLEKCFESAENEETILEVL